MGLGLVAGGVGTGLVMRARRSLRAAPGESNTVGDYRDRVAGDRRDEKIGWGMAATGLTLVSLGVVRYLTRDSGARTEVDKTVTLSPGAGSLSVRVQGSF